MQNVVVSVKICVGIRLRVHGFEYARLVNWIWHVFLLFFLLSFSSSLLLLPIFPHFIPSSFLSVCILFRCLFSDVRRCLLCRLSAIHRSSLVWPDVLRPLLLGGWSCRHPLALSDIRCLCSLTISLMASASGPIFCQWHSASPTGHAKIILCCSVDTNCLPIQYRRTFYQEVVVKMNRTVIKLIGNAIPRLLFR